MTDAKRDKNQVATAIALLNTNGLTIVPLEADQATHQLQLVDGTGNTDHGPANGKKDGNQVTTMAALSSDGLGTIVELYANSSGSLLIKSV